MKGLKNNKAVGNDGIPSEVYKFASERLLTMMSIFLSDCTLTGKLPNSLIHEMIIPLVKCKSKDPADVNNYRPSAITTALLSRSCCRESTGTCGLQTANLVSSKHMGQKWPFLQQTVDYYHNQDTPVYMCFLDAKKAFDRVNHWTLAKNC